MKQITKRELIATAGRFFAGFFAYIIGRIVYEKVITGWFA